MTKMKSKKEPFPIWQNDPKLSEGWDRVRRSVHAGVGTKRVKYTTICLFADLRKPRAKLLANTVEAIGD